MSPTVVYYKSIRFMIRTKDHGPAHVHAVKDDCEAVVEIETGAVVRCHGFSKRDVARICKEVLVRKELLLEEWHAIHKED